MYKYLFAILSCSTFANSQAFSHNSTSNLERYLERYRKISKRMHIPSSKPTVRYGISPFWMGTATFESPGAKSLSLWPQFGHSSPFTARRREEETSWANRGPESWPSLECGTKDLIVEPKTFGHFSIKSSSMGINQIHHGLIVHSKPLNIHDSLGFYRWSHVGWTIQSQAIRAMIRPGGPGPQTKSKHRIAEPLARRIEDSLRNGGP